MQPSAGQSDATVLAVGPWEENLKVLGGGCKGQGGSEGSQRGKPHLIGLSVNTFTSPPFLFWNPDKTFSKLDSRQTIFNYFLPILLEPPGYIQQTKSKRKQIIAAPYLTIPCPFLTSHPSTQQHQRQLPYIQTRSTLISSYIAHVDQAMSQHAPPYIFYPSMQP